MALVAGLALTVGRHGGLDDLLTFDGRAGWGHAVPRIVIQSTTAKALDGRRPRWGSAGTDARTERTTSGSGAEARDVSRATTVIALLGTPDVHTLTLKAKGGAVCLDVSNTSTTVALFRRYRTWRWARSRLMAGLAAVVAEPLGRRAAVSMVAQVATLEAALFHRVHVHFLSNTR